MASKSIQACNTAISNYGLAEIKNWTSRAYTKYNLSRKKLKNYIPLPLMWNKDGVSICNFILEDPETASAFEEYFFTKSEKSKRGFDDKQKFDKRQSKQKRQKGIEYESNFDLDPSYMFLDIEIPEGDEDFYKDIFGIGGR